MSLVRFRPEAPYSADLAHLVERHLAKVEVAGSSPVIRSKRKHHSFEWCFLLDVLRACFGAPKLSPQARRVVSCAQKSRAQPHRFHKPRGFPVVIRAQLSELYEVMLVTVDTLATRVSQSRSVVRRTIPTTRMSGVFLYGARISGFSSRAMR